MPLQRFRSARALKDTDVERGKTNRAFFTALGAAQAPSDGLLDVLSLKDVLCPHQDLIRRIKLAYGADRSHFDKELLPIIERFAGYVHLLPATAGNYFREPGGLLRMSLAVAFFASQAVDATLFEGLKTISQRQHLEPRWRLATFIAGLCAEVHRPITQMAVTSDVDRWKPYLNGVSNWARDNGLKRYQVRWIENQQEARAAGLFALPHIVQASTMQFLADGNSLIVPHMLAAIAGTPVYRSGPNVVDTLVRRCVSLVVDTEVEASFGSHAPEQRAPHLERLFLEAMRELIASGDWTVNAENSAVWYASDGAFLLWPRAAEDMLRLLEKCHLNGVPSNVQTVLQVLRSSSMVDDVEGKGALVRVRLPNATAAVTAVRLSAESLIDSLLPPAFKPLLTPLVAPESAPTPRSPELNLFEPFVDTAHDNVRERDQATVSDQLEEGAQVGSIQPTASPEAVAPAPVSSLPAAQTLSLRLSHRLPPPVRAALLHILSTVRNSSTPAARVLPNGLFIPLEAFTNRGVDTAVAVDSMQCASMLAPNEVSATKTVQADWNGRDAVGVLIRSDLVEGLSSLATAGAS